MAKLWGGRFAEELDADAVQLSYSLRYDRCLFPYDIRTNRAYAKGLMQVGILSADEFRRIDAALAALAQRYDDGDKTLFSGPDEDVHSVVERLVTEALGNIGKKMHTGKSRNDQVATDVRLFVKDHVQRIEVDISQLQYVLYRQAVDYETVIFPGFTHFQPAQPVLLAHHFLAYFEKFERDRVRMGAVLRAADVCPLGSGALAGNSFGIDRHSLATELGFASITNNSMDAVSDRDFILDFLSAASVLMAHLSGFCEEIVLWTSPVVGIASLGDAFTTGSSLMPQKKNSDMAELIRGKSGRVTGHLVGLLQVIKGLPLTYNRDLQEDKEPLLDTVSTVSASLRTFRKMLTTLRFDEQAIANMLKKGYMNATDFADYLVRKGVPFREAHELTGKVVRYAISVGKGLEDLALSDFQRFSSRIEADVFEALTMESVIRAKAVWGGTAFSEVQKQLSYIKEHHPWVNEH
ncbi:MAG: argininosuccinate lyase [Candidatus Margulisiibacteriota bacterium]